MPIICPAGHTLSEPTTRIGDVGVCPECRQSFAFNADGSTRRATAADTVNLTEDERQTLRAARGRTR